jgi:outer membrane receptor for ferrienterochelin and colicins
MAFERALRVLAAALVLAAPISAHAQDDAGVPVEDPDAVEETPVEEPTEPPVEPEEEPAPPPDEEVVEEDEPSDDGGEPSEEDEFAIEGADEIEEIDLESLLSGEVVLSVSRTAERADDAPAAVTVITREQIRIWGYQSVAEILERIVGFYTTDDHMIPNVAVRGITGGLRAESGLLKVMIDGRPVSFRPTGGNWVGPELIPMSAVERIEIIRGPASTVYGADAFLGVINVITREAERVDGLELWSTGNYGGGFGGGFDLTMGGRHGDFSAIAALRIHREDRSGLRLPDSSPAPSLRPNVDRTARANQLILDSASVFSRFTYHIDEDSSISLTGNLSAIDRNGDFADWLQLASGLDSAGRQRGSTISLVRGYLDLSADIRVSPEFRLNINGGFFAGAPTDRERIDVGSDVSYVRREMDFHAGQGEINALWRPIAELQIVGGADVLVDHQTLPGTLQVLLSDAGSLRAGEVRDETSVRQGTQDFVNLGLYLLGNWNPIDELRINAGLRFDYNNIYSAQFNGRVGGSLRIIDELSVKLNYNSAFRAPTTQLLYGTPLRPGDILGNSSLSPQQIHTWQGDITATPLEWLRIQTSLSYSYISDVAVFVPVGVNNVARNISELGVWAWETEARVNWENQLWAYANLAVVTGQRSVEEEGYRGELVGSDLQIYPPVVVNFGLTYRFQDFPLRLGAEGRFISDRRASDPNIIANGAVYHLPAAFYLDANVALVDVELFEGHMSTFTFSVRNITGERAAHPGFGGIDYPSAPRTYLLQWQQEL